MDFTPPIILILARLIDAPMQLSGLFRIYNIIYNIIYKIISPIMNKNYIKQ